MKFLPFQKTGVGRYFLRYHNKSKKNIILSFQNLSFTTPNSKSSYWVVIKINGYVAINKECWSVFSNVDGDKHEYYRGLFYSIPYLSVISPDDVANIVIEIDHETTYRRPVELESTPYVLVAMG